MFNWGNVELSLKTRWIKDMLASIPRDTHSEEAYLVSRVFPPFDVDPTIICGNTLGHLSEGRAAERSIIHEIL